MVNLVMMFIASMSVNQSDFSKDDVGGGMHGFSVNQHGKLVLVKSASWPDQVEFADAREVLIDFLSEKGNITEQMEGQRITSVGRVPLKQHTGIGNHVAGDIHYTLVIENNGVEFNYWFTDLAYQPYRNDRYGKRIKATATPIPLERRLSKINGKIWEKQKGYAQDALDDLSEQLLRSLQWAGKSAVFHTGT
ncbi:MAG TPA: hypothetical protein VNQ55_03930 [Parapedobacter sp.]|nr:hypothetical protein [Parapedobacter sp.]